MPAREQHKNLACPAPHHPLLIDPAQNDFITKELSS
jgi:hypothetical protein